MKRWLAILATAAATSGTAFGDAQVSLDVQAMAAASPIDGVPAVAARASGLVMGTSGAGSVGASSAGSPTDAIVGVEVRPSFAFSRGFRLGVGFRAGKGATLADGSVDTGSTSLWGGDLSLGFQKWFGRLMPFVEARFGFNAYSIDLPGGGTLHADQLRLDGVLGARVYFGESFYLAASAFGGWGDRYGGTVGLGWDVVRYRSRGVMP